MVARKFSFLIVCFIFCCTPLLHATETGGGLSSAVKRTGMPVPRFASLKSDEVNMRSGPGQRYPIVWVYKRKAMPVEITAN